MQTARTGPAGDFLLLRPQRSLPRDAIPTRAYRSRGD
jgi:hypothetical protein